MKVLENILKRPLIASIYYTGSLAVLLLIYALMNASSSASDSVGFAGNALPLNFALTVLSLGVTLLPGTLLRFFTFEIIWRKLGHRSALAAVLIIGEIFGMIFLLNFYMGSITSGGLGSLALVLVSLINIGIVIFWGIAAAAFWAGTKNKSDLPPSDWDAYRSH